MKKIKVLMVMGSTQRAGAETYVMNVIRSIDREKFQIDIAVRKGKRGEYDTEILELGCSIFDLPSYKITNIIGYKKKWSEFFDQHHYDIVHGNLSNSAFLYLKIAKEHGCATIVHSHSSSFRGGIIEKKIKKYTSHLAKRSADYWFACSEIAAFSHYGEDFKAYKNYYYIPNAIIGGNYRYNSGTRQKIRKQYDISDTCFLCGHVGSFTAPKNHLFLLEIFKEIKKMRSESRLILIGDGLLKENIKKRAEEFGILSDIIFTGSVNNVNEHMMAMDFMIFPSLFEGLGIVVIEAQATGLYSIVSDEVPKEACLTDIVEYKSLNDSAKLWAKRVMEHDEIDRISYNKIICQSDFNMMASVKKLERIYCECIDD